jgi:hypothetical protein
VSAAILAIDLVTKFIQAFNKGFPEALKLYRSIEAIVKSGGGDPFPELPDSAVIDLLKQRAERGVAWADEELAKLA